MALAACGGREEGADAQQAAQTAAPSAESVPAPDVEAASPASQPSVAVNLGPHGALAMDAQIERLAKFIPDGAAAPAGVDPIAWSGLYVPADNALSPDRIALGRKLYFDPRLSADGTVACATCHDVSRGFTDQRPVSEGIGDQLGRRNAPTTLNAALFQTQFLDGRAPTLEEQAKLPVVNPIEMGHGRLEDAVAAIADDAEYQQMFRAAYDSAPNGDDLAKAIASFERTLIFLDAPFDRYAAGDENAMSEQAKRGLALFNGKARCVSCHMINASNPLGTDNRFHNIGIAARVKNFETLARQALHALAESGGDIETVDRLALETDMSELGRFIVTKDRGDIGAFKTSQLRNLAVTAPYMHDGSLTTLWDVMDHYNKGGEANPFLDGGIEPLALTEAEISDLVAFMFALTDYRFQDEAEQALAAQMEKARKQRPFRDRALADREIFPFEARIGLADTSNGGGGK
ncbi:MAG: cytochrome c peroxidase [Pseudomonadota bacterium]|nr:cytochrome c peroxidase [Pseudomonadota bacterium]